MLKVFLCPPLYYKFFLIVLMAVSILSQKGPKQTPSEDTEKKNFRPRPYVLTIHFHQKILSQGPKSDP